MSVPVRYVGICPAADLAAARAAIDALGYGPECFIHELFDGAGPPIGIDDVVSAVAYACDWAMPGARWPAVKSATVGHGVAWHNEGSLQSRRMNGKGLGRIKTLQNYKSRGE